MEILFQDKALTERWTEIPYRFKSLRGFDIDIKNIEYYKEQDIQRYKPTFDLKIFDYLNHIGHCKLRIETTAPRDRFVPINIFHIFHSDTYALISDYELANHFKQTNGF